MKTSPGIEIAVFLIKAFLLGVVVWALVYAVVAVFLEIRPNTGDTLGDAFVRTIQKYRGN